MKVSLFAGDQTAHYVLGLLSGLTSQRIWIDFIGNDEMQNSEAIRNENVNYLNLRGDQNPSAPIEQKLLRVLKYYFRLIKYAAKTDSKLFHIQGLNKFEKFDRTILNIYYKLLGKKLVYTAHNVNAAERDDRDSFMNRLTLWFMYKIVDYIFVHTNKMKIELIEGFNVREDKVKVMPIGIFNIAPNTEMTGTEARKRIGVKNREKILLFFGRISNSKGLKHLVLALESLKKKHNDLRLIIAGKIEKDCDAYWEEIQRIIKESNLREFIIEKAEFIPDWDVEIFFKAADVVILPYENIFQSGVPFLAFNFGLPIIATDVGSLREVVIDNETGYICQMGNPKDLGEKIDFYFHSDLYKNLEKNRHKIIEYAKERYSWEKIGEKTYSVYENLLSNKK